METGDVKKEKVTIKTSWDDVTLGDYQKIVDLPFEDMEDEADLNCNLLAVLSDRDYDFWNSVDYSDYLKAVGLIAFVNQPPTPNKIAKHKYVVGGVKYNIAESAPAVNRAPVGELRTIQFLGLISKRNEVSDLTYIERMRQFHREIAIMMIPEGKQYGVEGYSISKNAEHLQKHLGIRDALAVSAFFLLVWKALSKGLSASLDRQMKKMKKKGMMDQEQMEQLKAMMRTITESGPPVDSLINGAGNTRCKW